MPPAPLRADEADRLAALLRLKFLDSEAESAYDELTHLAAAIFRVPIALISVVDRDRQWFKSRVGLDACQTPRDYAFCSHAILHDEVMVVEDALLDERFATNPLVVSEPNIRFYAGAPLKTPDGTVLGTLCVIDRIPREFGLEMRSALQVLAKQVISQLELRRTCGRLQECARQLQEANVAKDKFLHVIAHDLRGPFNGIIGYSDLLVKELAGPGLEEYREMAEEIADHGRSTLELVDRLLEWAMCESGRMEFKPGVIALDELIGEVLEVTMALARNKGVELSFAGADGVEVSGDRYMLFSVVQNLIHNAIKFTSAGGRVRVVVWPDGNLVRVAVQDTGVGIPEDVRRALFRIGEVTSTAGTGGEEGTGLGLLLCAQFVGRHGGELEVASEERKGSIFRFSLARHAAAVRPAAGEVACRT